MERDELDAAWLSLEQHLRRTERLNDLLVAQSMTGRAQSALVTEKRWIVTEVVLNYAGVVALGSFAASHAAHASIAVCAGILAAALIAVNIGLIRIAVAIAGLDYDEPVVAIQSALERIRMQRARLTAAILFTAPLLWLPMLGATLGLLGIDAFRVLTPAYLAANAAFGVAVAIAGWFAARKLDTRNATNRWVRVMLDALSGTSYREASQSLDTIERFASQT